MCMRIVWAASGNEQTYNVGIGPSVVKILAGEYALQCLREPCTLLAWHRFVQAWMEQYDESRLWFSTRPIASYRTCGSILDRVDHPACASGTRTTSSLGSRRSVLTAGLVGAESGTSSSW